MALVQSADMGADSFEAFCCQAANHLCFAVLVSGTSRNNPWREGEGILGRRIGVGGGGGSGDYISINKY